MKLVNLFLLVALINDGQSNIIKECHKCTQAGYIYVKLKTGMKCFPGTEPIKEPNFLKVKRSVDCKMLEPPPTTTTLAPTTVSTMKNVSTFSLDIKYPSPIIKSALPPTPPSVSPFTEPPPPNPATTLSPPTKSEPLPPQLKITPTFPPTSSEIRYPKDIIPIPTTIPVPPSQEIKYHRNDPTTTPAWVPPEMNTTPTSTQILFLPSNVNPIQLNNTHPVKNEKNETHSLFTCPEAVPDVVNEHKFNLKCLACLQHIVMGNIRLNEKGESGLSDFVARKRLHRCLHFMK